MKKHIKFGYLAAVAFSGLHLAGPAYAQEVDIQYPLNTNCELSAPNNLTNCTTNVIGSETFTTIVPLTVTPLAPPVFRLVGQTGVDFNGTLQVEGVHLDGSNFAASVFLSPDLFFPPSVQIGVDLTTQYNANFDVNFDASLFGGSFSGMIRANPGYTYQVNSATVSAIRYDANNQFYTMADGRLGLFNLTAANPTSITNNTVALSGTYNSYNAFGPAGAIEFGKLTGTAELLSGTLTSQQGFALSSSVGPTYLSPFALKVDTTATVLTKLDETGLIAPTIAVTDGIDTNGSVISNLGAGVAATDAVNKAQLDAEAAARTAADAALAAGVAAEATTRAAADTALAGQISTEASARAAVDVALGTSIDTQATARANADTALGTRVDTEAATRTAADTALGNQVVSEATARAAADVTMGASVDSAVSIRASTVAAADQRIANEASARSAADTALAGQLISESNARIAADTGLSARLDGLGTGLAGYGARLDQLDRRIASGTAVAVALSGSTFLPGQKHNVSFNVATYDGAHAASMQFAAMVAPKVAFNFGVATGLNKGGRTAARLGIIFSW